jgi:hypothetical protein
MKTPEAKVKDAVVRVLKEYDCYYFFPATHGFGRSGVPDIICCYKGRFIGIECKAEKGRLTDLQERELQRIRKRAGVAIVAAGNEAADMVRGYLKILSEEPK